MGSRELSKVPEVEHGLVLSRLTHCPIAPIPRNVFALKRQSILNVVIPIFVVMIEWSPESLIILTLD